MTDPALGFEPETLGPRSLSAKDRLTRLTAEHYREAGLAVPSRPAARNDLSLRHR